MKPDTISTARSVILVACVFVLVVMAALKADRNYVLLTVGLGTVAAIIGARQPA